MPPCPPAPPIVSDDARQFGLHVKYEYLNMEGWEQGFLPAQFNGHNVCLFYSFSPTV